MAELLIDAGSGSPWTATIHLDGISLRVVTKVEIAILPGTAFIEVHVWSYPTDADGTIQIVTGDDGEQRFAPPIENVYQCRKLFVQAEGPIE
jgi:hypothetical protein